MSFTKVSRIANFAWVFACATLATQGQTWTSGSTGSDGALTLTTPVQLSLILRHFYRHWIRMAMGSTTSRLLRLVKVCAVKLSGTCFQAPCFGLRPAMSTSTASSI